MTLPSTPRGWLVCEGLCQRATLHEFDRRIQIEADSKEAGQYYFVLVYACSECGDKRVWGSEEI